MNHLLSTLFHLSIDPFTFKTLASMSQQHQPNPDKSDKDAEGFPPKPKRPLTVFNLFGKLERNYIVQSSQKRAPVSFETSSTEGTTSESSHVSAVDPYLDLRPEKYRDIVSMTMKFKFSFYLKIHK